MLMRCGQLAPVAVAVLSVLVAAPASADVLLEQPPDLANRWASFYYGSGHQKADDFRPSEDVVVESVVAWMVATHPNGPANWSFSVHRLDFEHLIYPYAPAFDHVFRMFNPSSVTDLGPWPGEDDLRLYEVRFDNIALRLDAGVAADGIYWFCFAGHLANYPIDRCYWATANSLEPVGDVAYQRQYPWYWPGWIRIDEAKLPPSDFAMRIEGVPADEWQPTTELTTFEVDYGRDIEGDLDALREAGDNAVVTFKSNPGRRDGQKYYIASITTTAQCLLDDPDVLDVSVSADVQRIFQVPDALVFLLNRRTNEWDEVGRHEIYLERDTWPIRGIAAADYLGADGEIKLKFEVRGGPITHPQERFTYFFRANIDRVQIDARRVD
jgi:hypothetical protein